MNKVVDVDWLIVGAGPAGIQLGYFCEKNNLNYVILEKSDSVASFFKNFPRHGQLISINKVYTGFDDDKLNLRWDWNSLLSEGEIPLFKEFSKEYFPRQEDLVIYLQNFVKKSKLKIEYDAEVISISKEANFIIETKGDKVYKSNKLFIATGVGQPYIPDIPGVEHADNYFTMSLDLKQY